MWRLCCRILWILSYCSKTTRKTHFFSFSILPSIKIYVAENFLCMPKKALLLLIRHKKKLQTILFCWHLVSLSSRMSCIYSCVHVLYSSLPSNTRETQKRETIIMSSNKILIKISHEVLILICGNPFRWNLLRYQSEHCK